jgi:glycosylphosphatidylinositol transamidase
MLGMFLATLATLNFSLAFFVGLLSFPFSFLGVPPAAEPEANQPSLPAWKMVLSNIALHCLSPPVVFYTACRYSGIEAEQALMEAAFGWTVWGLWTQVIVWCVWWPAWLVSAVFVSPSI